MFAYGARNRQGAHRLQPIPQAQTHNPKVAGSNPAPAIFTKLRKGGGFRLSGTQTKELKRLGQGGFKGGRFRPRRAAPVESVDALLVFAGVDARKQGCAS
jgi:hypothetical protein